MFSRYSFSDNSTHILVLDTHYIVIFRLTVSCVSVGGEGCSPYEFEKGSANERVLKLFSVVGAPGYVWGNSLCIRL